MSIQFPTSPIARSPFAPPTAPRSDESAGTQGSRAPVRPEPAAVPAPAPNGLAPAAGALPAEPPAGTDPELWAVLTGEERAFFAKVGAMGPLTYGRIMTQGPQAPAAPIARGVRLDVRA